MSAKQAFRLRPPDKNDKPVRVAPTRKPPIVKFVPEPPPPSKADAETPETGVVVAPPSEEVSGRKKTPFLLYLNRRREEGTLVDLQAIEAHNFLGLAKYPVKGLSQFSAREDVKRVGAKWTPNPSFTKMQLRGGENMPGWWSAPNQDTLRELLEMRDAQSMPLWHPLELSDAAGERLLSLFSEFRRAEENQKQAKENAQTEEREERDRARATRQQFDLAEIPDDAKEDIERLRQEFGVLWTSEMAAAASQIPWLGPHAGISSVRRVLRAFHHKMILADDVNNNRWIDPDDWMRKGTTSRTEDEAQGSVTGKAQLGVNTFFFGKSPGLWRLPSDAELRRSLDGWQRRNVERAIRRPQGKLRVHCADCCCEACGTLVIDQFRECACAGRVWTPCKYCTYLQCAEQPCGCVSAGWADRQSKCRAKLPELDNTVPKEL